jgi:hypothetical protein
MVASAEGWMNYREGRDGGDRTSKHAIHICPHCRKPTYFDDSQGQVPGAIFGSEVKHITNDNIIKLYDEARKATGAGAYTAAVLSCRKLLMHIAVSKGADENKKFEYYVQFLANKNLIPPDALDWVDHIRTKGNEANHDIVIMAKTDAEELVSFIEMLLKMIFEFPAIAKSKKTKTT